MNHVRNAKIKKKLLQNANGNVQIRQAWKFLKIFIVKNDETQ